MFYFRAGEFFQNNSSILSAFVAYVVGQARGEGVQFLADVYCGVGLFAISAQGHFAGVEGIEICGEAVRLARLNASIGGVTGVNFSIGEAERIFSFFPYPADRSAVILDPPRRGCGTAFLRQLSAFAPRRIVYVSCCPESQANDLRPLLRDYSIAAIQPIDLFPQTRHIENVVTLEKNIAGGR
jgi:23S rRNA (uracil1939-C5)-methyltransferase/tRNA (uracil-5-)-methyltransferase